MGDAESGAIQFSFNPHLRVEFWGATVTSTSVWVRSSRDTSPNVVADAVANSSGWDLYRLSIYSRLAAYEDTEDAERLAVDATFRMLASRERRETCVALTATLDWVRDGRPRQGAKLSTRLPHLNTKQVRHAIRR